MDFEFGFKTLWGVAVAAFWFWMNQLSARQKEADRRDAELLRELHEIRLNYATKDELRGNQESILRSLHRLEEKMDRMNDRLERKADK